MTSPGAVKGLPSQMLCGKGLEHSTETAYLYAVLVQVIELLLAHGNDPNAVMGSVFTG